MQNNKYLAIITKYLLFFYKKDTYNVLLIQSIKLKPAV